MLFYVKEKIEKYCLMNVLRVEWNKISIKVLIINLIDSLSKKCATVIKAMGYLTKY